jgi:ankyrin repeat protein
MIASHNGHKQALQLLIDRGADVNLTKKKGLNALALAKQKNQTEIADFLTTLGAKADLHTNGQLQPFEDVSNNILSEIEIF